MTTTVYPRPETVRTAQVFYAFYSGRYGNRSDWVASPYAVAVIQNGGARIALQRRVSGDAKPEPVWFRWSEAKDRYVVSSRYAPVDSSAELRPALDPDVVYARKLAVARWLRQQTATSRSDKYGNPEDTDAYVARISEAATQAGTRLLRIQEGL